MKYIDILNIIRYKDLENFLNQIKKKEIKNGNKNIDEYINSVKNLLFGYEKWFNEKIGRSFKKKNKLG